MSDKKRKRETDGKDASHKKASKLPTGTLKVRYVENKAPVAPVLAKTPGLSVPSGIAFKPYRSKKITPDGAEMLLQSSDHSHIDYVAEEEHDGSSESQLVHYTAVVDLENKSIEIMPLRQVVVRGTLRSETQEMRDEQAQHTARKNTATARKYALATEFGSRKSRKALEERTMNAIRSDNPNAGPASNAVAENVLRDMAAKTGAMPTKEELLAAVDSSKPRPMPNLQAEHPGDVYTSETVVGNDLMMLIDVGDWVEKSNNGIGVEIFSQYVARRLAKLAHNKQIQKLKVLRFIMLCVCFNDSLSGTGGNRPKKIPAKERLEASMGNDTPTAWITAIRRKFAQESGSEMPRWNVDNLITHVLAAALIVDDFECDVADLKDDLKLKNADIKRYFQELGCRISVPTESDLTKRGLQKSDANNHSIARLKIPLKFPQVNGPKAKRR